MFKNCCSYQALTHTYTWQPRKLREQKYSFLYLLMNFGPNKSTTLLATSFGSFFFAKIIQIEVVTF